MARIIAREPDAEKVNAQIEGMDPGDVLVLERDSYYGRLRVPAKLCARPDAPLVIEPHGSTVSVDGDDWAFLLSANMDTPLWLRVDGQLNLLGGGLYLGRSELRFVGHVRVANARTDAVKIIGDTQPVPTQWISSIRLASLECTGWGEDAFDCTGGRGIDVDKMHLHLNNDLRDNSKNAKGAGAKNCAKNVTFGEVLIEDCTFAQAAINCGGRCANSTPDRWEVENMEVGSVRFVRVTAPELVSFQAASGVKIHRAEAVECVAASEWAGYTEPVGRGMLQQQASEDCYVNSVGIVGEDGDFPPLPTPEPAEPTTDEGAIEALTKRVEALEKKYANLKTLYAELDESVSGKASSEHHHNGGSQLVHVKTVPTGSAVEPEKEGE